MKRILIVIPLMLCAGCSPLMHSWYPQTRLVAVAGNARVDETNSAPMSDRNVAVTETIVFYSDGLTTQSITRKSEYGTKGDSIVSIFNILSGIVGAVAGYYAKGKVGGK